MPPRLTQEAGFTEADLDALVSGADGPVLLDLFACQGGAAAGYRAAGFFVICLDLDPQRHNPHPMIQADAVWFLRTFAAWIRRNVRAVHGSPPCQAYTKAQQIQQREHPELVEPVRELLDLIGLPYVLENVEGAPLHPDLVLCGSMFGIRTYRHRVFELGGWKLGGPPPAHPAHTARTAKMGRPVADGEFMHIVGNFSGVKLAKKIMVMPWATRDGLREAIPPCYAEWIGRHLMAFVRRVVPAQRKPSDSACTLYTQPTDLIGDPMAPRASTKSALPDVTAQYQAAASVLQRAAETAAGIDPFATPSGPKADGVRRDKRWGHYLAPTPPDTENPNGGTVDVHYTRATTMAKAISDTFALEQWAGRMIVKGLALRPDLRALAAATPLEDRQTLNKIAEDAKTAAGNKVAANLGTARHALTELYDRGQPLPPLEPEESADLEAYKAVLAAEGIKVVGDFIERSVFVPKYGVAGTLDRVVEMPDGTFRIADLKTGKDLSYGWGEISIQLKIYQLAEWYYDYATNTWHRMPETDPDLGLVIHLPVNGGEATTYDVDLRVGQIGLDLSHQVRDWRKNKTIAEARKTARAAAEAAPVVEPATPFQRVMAATNKAGLAALWDELNPLGLWTPEVHAAATAQLTKFSTN